MPDGSTTFASKGQKHHYIPAFYLKQWVGPDGRLCEFSRPHEKVKPRRTFPDGTGYVRGLYTLNSLPPDAANFLENEFLLKADDRSYTALTLLVQNKTELDNDTRDAWSRFLMTLIHRTPEGISRMEQKIKAGMPAELEKFRPEYEALRQSVANAPDFDELCARFSTADYQAFLLRTLHRMMDSEFLGTTLNNLIWSVIKMERSRFPLLTSDRPIIMTNGLKKPGAHIVMPISPSSVFVAVDTEQTARLLEAQVDDPKFGERLNDFVARQARKYVYGTDDSQLRFVEKRLGEKAIWSPLE